MTEVRKKTHGGPPVEGRQPDDAAERGWQPKVSHSTKMGSLTHNGDARERERGSKTHGRRMAVENPLED